MNLLSCMQLSSIMQSWKYNHQTKKKYYFQQILNFNKLYSQIFLYFITETQTGAF